MSAWLLGGEKGYRGKKTHLVGDVSGCARGSISWGGSHRNWEVTELGWSAGTEGWDVPAQESGTGGSVPVDPCGTGTGIVTHYRELPWP